MRLHNKESHGSLQIIIRSHSPNNKREHVVRSGRSQITVVQQERILLHKQRRNPPTGVRHYTNVRTVPERFRLPTANALRPVVTPAPHVPREVRPLHHTLGAGDVRWQPHPVPEDVLLAGLRRNRVPDLARPAQIQRVPVEALLGGLVVLVVVRTQKQLEPAHVVRGQLDFHVNLLPGKVPPRDDPPAVLSARFVGLRIPQVVSVPADTALALVLFPLDGVTTAEQLVVVVVDRVGEAEAPHGVPGRWFHQAAMAEDQRGEREELQKTQQQHRDAEDVGTFGAHLEGEGRVERLGV